MLARRRPRRIGDRLLAEQHERAFGQPFARLADRREEVLLAAADVDGAGPPHVLGAPRDRTVERPVELERRRAVPVAAQQRAVPAAEGVAAQRRERVRHHVGHDNRRLDAAAAGYADAGDATIAGQHGLDARAGDDRAAAAREIAGQRLRQVACAAARRRPADRVAEQVQVEAGHRRSHTRGWVVRVHHGPVEPRARAAVAEQAPRRDGRRLGQQARERERVQRTHAAEHLQRPADRREAGEHGVADRVPRLDEWPREGRPGIAVARPQPVERRGRRVEIAVQRRAAVAAQRVREAGLRVNPLEAEVRERHAPEHRRRRTRRVDGGHHVVVEAGQRQLGGPDRAAGCVGCLQDGDGAPRLGEPDRGSEPVRPAPDDDRVGHAVVDASDG